MTGLEFLSDPEVLADPYPLFHQLQREQPVCWRGLSGAWFVTRYADVKALLNDERLSAATVSKSLRSLAGLSQLDPPDHTRLRKIMSNCFMAKVHDALPEHIAEMTGRLIDELRRTPQPVDLIGVFAAALPTLVNARLIGVPVERHDQWKELTEVFGASFGSVGGQNQLALLKRTRQLLQREVQHFREVLGQRRLQPQYDLISALNQAQDEGLLSENELLRLCLETLFAGQETTTDLLGNGLLALLHHPAQLQQLRDEPCLMPRAVEEMLRYDSPVQMTVRLAKEEIHLHGKTILAGQKVVLCLGAANRDPAQFPHPDQFDIARRHNRHLAFGFGAHYCLGAALSRVLAAIAFPRLLRALPDLRLASADLQWHPSPIYRGLKAMPVYFSQ